MDTVRRFPPILSLSLCSHRAPARRGRLPTRMGRTATGRAGSGVHSEKNERSKQSSQRKKNRKLTNNTIPFRNEQFNSTSPQ
jgi:hypothetical protein